MTGCLKNGIVGTITTLALTLLFWPVLGSLFERARGLLRPVKSGG